MSTDDSSNALPANFDESLIDLVRQNPLLFVKDTRVKPYESMKERYDLWKSIATSLGVEPNFCMTRWRNLRDRYRRAILNKKKNQPADDWPLMEKMRFLDRSVSRSHMLSHKLKEDLRKVPTVETASKAKETFSGINYDYLPEAMEAQSSTSNDAFNKAIPLMTCTTSTSTNSVLVRIKALLDGLDPINRVKAEKRILSYLCKCQLKTLENENIDDIEF